MTSIVKCPNCKKPVEWSEKSLFRPFCSERCRLIDLGSWADGSYAIPSSESVNPDSEQSSENQDSNPSTPKEDDNS